jgi:hypothetical protein
VPEELILVLKCMALWSWTYQLPFTYWNIRHIVSNFFKFLIHIVGATPNNGWIYLSRRFLSFRFLYLEYLIAGIFCLKEFWSIPMHFAVIYVSGMVSMAFSSCLDGRNTDFWPFLAICCILPYEYIYIYQV